jgi:hypothetical protein
MTTMSVRRRRPGYHRAAGRTLVIVLGFAAVRRRETARHRAWMIRAYAIALAEWAVGRRPAPCRRPQPAVAGAQP